LWRAGWSFQDRPAFNTEQNGVVLLIAIGIAILAAVFWVARTAVDEQGMRERRIQRDYDLRRG
jgi:hypothetical protein